MLTHELRRAVFAATLTLAACGGARTTGGDGAAQTDAATGGDTASAETGADVTGAETGVDSSGPDAVSIDAAPADARPADASLEAGCAGEPLSCVSGTAGGSCGDAFTPSNCAAGAWTCPAGTIDARMCACVGRPPGSGCVCMAGGWACPDAGGPDAQRDTGGAACIGRPAGCAAGTAGGACSDAVTSPTCVDGSWRCGAGEVPITECACVGAPPGRNCTCTTGGWSCGADAGADASPEASVDAGRTFACGSMLQCASGREYCSVTTGGAVGTRPSYTCRAVPSSCTARLSCACFSGMGGTRCEQSPEGDITVTLLAP